MGGESARWWRVNWIKNTSLFLFFFPWWENMARCDWCVFSKIFNAFFSPFRRRPFGSNYTLSQSIFYLRFWKQYRRNILWFFFVFIHCSPQVKVTLVRGFFCGLEHNVDSSRDLWRAEWVLAVGRCVRWCRWRLPRVSAVCLQECDSPSRVPCKHQLLLPKHTSEPVNNRHSPHSEVRLHKAKEHVWSSVSVPGLCLLQCRSVIKQAPYNNMFYTCS